MVCLAVLLARRFLGDHPNAPILVQNLVNPGYYGLYESKETGYTSILSNFSEAVLRSQTCLLVVEDDEKYIRRADEAARAAGFDEVEARVTVAAARKYLENGLEQDSSLPDGILLDLDLGYESGYELLRFWHKTPRLRSIPLVVWSVLGPEHADVCKMFKVNSFVSKWEDPTAFREALASLVR